MAADDADAAFATPFIALRPATFDTIQPRLRASIIVRYPGGDQLLQIVVRGLLRRDWELIAPPVGAFEFDEQTLSPTAAVVLHDSKNSSPGDCTATITVGPETVFEGRLALNADTTGATWEQLHRETGEVLVFVTVGNEPIVSEQAVDDVARAGHLVGVVGVVKTTT